MTRVYVALIVAILLLLGGGAIFLATWDIPPPSTRVEKVIPSDKMER